MENRPLSLTNEQKLAFLTQKVEFYEDLYKAKLALTNKKEQIEDRLNKKLDYLLKIKDDKFTIKSDEKVFLTSKTAMLNCKLPNAIQESIKLDHEKDSFSIDFSRKVFKYIFEILLRSSQSYNSNELIKVYIKKRDDIDLKILCIEIVKFFFFEKENYKQFAGKILLVREDDYSTWTVFYKRIEKDNYAMENLSNQKDNRITQAKIDLARKNNEFIGESSECNGLKKRDSNEDEDDVYSKDDFKDTENDNDKDLKTNHSTMESIHSSQIMKGETTSAGDKSEKKKKKKKKKKKPATSNNINNVNVTKNGSNSNGNNGPDI